MVALGCATDCLGFSMDFVRLSMDVPICSSRGSYGPRKTRGTYVKTKEEEGCCFFLVFAICLRSSSIFPALGPTSS